MRGVAIVAACCSVGVALASCRHAPEDKLGAAPSHDQAASASASTSASTKLDAQSAHAVAMAWTAIGCFVGGPWSEALGAVAEERTLADIARCRDVETKLLEAKITDAATLDALRAVDPKVVDRVVDAFVRAAPKLPAARKNTVISILRASADASREALEVRKAATALRAKDAKVDDAATKTLGTTKALEVLARVADVAAQNADGLEAKVVFLVLAADRLEMARGLPPRAQLAVGAPASKLLFGVAPRSDETDDRRAWIELLEAAGRTAKHPPQIPPQSTKTDDPRLREMHARMLVAAALAERFDDARKQLENGVILSVASGYVDRLRASIEEAREKEKISAETKPSASITSP